MDAPNKPVIIAQKPKSPLHYVYEIRRLGGFWVWKAWNRQGEIAFTGNRAYKRRGDAVAACSKVMKHAESGEIKIV